MKLSDLLGVVLGATVLVGAFLAGAEVHRASDGRWTMTGGRWCFSLKLPESALLERFAGTDHVEITRVRPNLASSAAS
ncbi:hypothetical protein [Brevundimonas sp.]|uniref:hypothetical protein n=1 Tax=Brevundimonas sp. TaxID=1871086 RepID=UPI0028A60007|nr:hypothetical protein [Brevundimonas sp.]